jgi:hypothetical protein
MSQIQNKLMPDCYKIWKIIVASKALICCIKCRISDQCYDFLNIFAEKFAKSWRQNKARF